VFCLGPLLALDGERAIRQLNLDIFFLEARKLGRDPHLFVVLAHLDARPRPDAVEHAVEAEGAELEPTKDVVEQAVHLTMQSQEGRAFLSALHRNATAAVPGNEISHAHVVSPFSVVSPISNGRRAWPGPRETTSSRPDRTSDQAACFCSICWGSPREGPDLTAIRRGFMASGNSRTKSTCRSPSSNEAPFTST